VKLDPTAMAARIYLYADGTAGTRTVTEYRNVTLQPSAAEIVDVRPAAPSGLTDTPTVQYATHGSERVGVKLRGATQPQLVVFDESFGPGWQATGARIGQHVLVNGYANAWLVPAGDHDFEMRFGPSRLAHLALWISIVTALAAVVWVVGRRRRRASAPDGWSGHPTLDGPPASPPVG
jgi:hypothetical protein